MPRSLLALLLLLGSFGTALAQIPKLPIGGDSGQREPNDQIEGIVWEYKGTLDKAASKEDKENKPTLEGKIRMEGSAVFDVSPTFRIPSKKEVDKVLDKVRAGEGAEVKLPGGVQQKRLGEYRKVSGGKIRIDFNDKESLNGIMLVWKKKKTDDVYIGTFSERQGDKEIRKWDVQLRPIED